MRALWATGALALLTAGLALSGCAEGGLAGNLRSAGVGSTTPDEFLVLPTKPLELPENLAALPPPTTGATSRADRQPEAEAVAALTGRPGPAGSAGAAALIARAGPVAPGIRTTLAAEDAVYRDENRGRFLERVFKKNDDQLIYQNMALDSSVEFDRLRRRGVQVPAAPPVWLPVAEESDVGVPPAR